MKMNRILMALLLASATGFAAPAYAVPKAGPDTPSLLHAVAADCHAVGQQIAAQNGGQLARAAASSQSGQSVCVIVVLVPGKDGARPRRMEIIVPRG